MPKELQLNGQKLNKNKIATLRFENMLVSTYNNYARNSYDETNDKNFKDSS